MDETTKLKVNTFSIIITCVVVVNCSNCVELPVL